MPGARRCQAPVALKYRQNKDRRHHQRALKYRQNPLDTVTDTPEDAPETANTKDAPDTVTMKIGTFNCGIMQTMLQSKNNGKIIADLNRIIATCAIDAQLDIFSMCEVGGHRQGPLEAGINLKTLDVVRKGANISESQNYVSSWNLNEGIVNPSINHGVLRVRQLREPVVISLDRSIAPDPQLQVQIFSFGGMATLVQGNLHIQTPLYMNVSKCTRIKIVKAALSELESTARTAHSPWRLLLDDTDDCAFQPVVCVLLGDTNLMKSEAEEAVQLLQPVADSEYDNVWSVHETLGNKGGDLLYVKGAHANLFELPIGCSYRDCGVRNNHHDAFGVELKVLVRRELEADTSAKRCKISEDLSKISEDAKNASTAQCPMPTKHSGSTSNTKPTLKSATRRPLGMPGMTPGMMPKSGPRRPPAKVHCQEPRRPPGRAHCQEPLTRPFGMPGMMPRQTSVMPPSVITIRPRSNSASVLMVPSVVLSPRINDSASQPVALNKTFGCYPTDKKQRIAVVLSPRINDSASQPVALNKTSGCYPTDKKQRIANLDLKSAVTTSAATEMTHTTIPAPPPHNTNPWVCVARPSPRLAPMKPTVPRGRNLSHGASHKG